MTKWIGSPENFNNFGNSIRSTMIFALVFFLSNPLIPMTMNFFETSTESAEGTNGSEVSRLFQLDSDILNQQGKMLIDLEDGYESLLPSSVNGTFQYPSGSSIIPMGNAQNGIQRRMLYKELFQRIYSTSDVEVIMDDFYYNSVKYPAGTLTSMNGFGGNFNYTIAKKPFNVSRGYSLHPRKIAIFKSDVTDSYGQNVTWEEGYFERIFRVYLWGDYFDKVNETDIKKGKLLDYEVLILPSIKKGYELSVANALGSNGLNKIMNFVRRGNFLYAQGGACYIAEAARLVPNGTVLLDKRINAANNHADMAVVNDSYPITQGWLSNKMYVIDDPVLNNTDPNAVVAKYTGNLTNSSLINTSAIMAFNPHKGNLVLINGHPSVNSDFYPIFFDVMFWAMAETSDLRATCRQLYNSELPYDLIPAQEANVTVQVEITYLNFWPDTNNSPKDVELTEKISPYFHVDEFSIYPKPTNITKVNVSYNGNGSGNGSGGGGGYGNGTNGSGGDFNPPPGIQRITEIVWNFRDDQGIRKFRFNASTYENSTKKGVVPVSEGLAKFTPPGFRGRKELRHGWTYIRAALAARLVGDRDIELDGCYPLRSSGEYFDIALTLENKEETTAKNITVIDIVCLKSPIVDVVNQSKVPNSWNNTNNGTNNPVFVVNEIFYYFDSNNKSLYPLPDEVYNTTYNYTYWNGTNITLPALKLVWHIQDLLAFDYLEPAIRYGIFSHEEYNRTVSCRSDPVKGSVILDAAGGSVFTNLGIHPIPYNQYLKHGVVSIPKGEEIPRVEYKDIWNRDHTMNLRTVFYDIVPFPPPEEHMVVTTTFEMTYNGERLTEFPIHHKVDLNFTLKTWNGYGKYDPKSYPYHMNITKNETMIVQAIPRGVGYNINYIDSSFNENTSLLMIHNTSTHTILYFQQDIAGGHKEVIDINTELSAYPSVHREGSMKVNDGARFVYHQIAVGPNRYEVFDSHVQAVFAIGNNVQVHKKAAPVFIATFGDDVYHFIRLEDPYEPREFLEDPYIKSHGFGDMAVTTYVGGRINETLFHSRVNPGGRTLVRIEIDNNLGYDLENVSITPVPPPGFKVTPDNFTTQIPPIFYDFPFINRTEIWDAWKAVYYFWVDVDSTVTGGKIYQVNFTLNSNCSNASKIPVDFEIPPAVIGVKDESGHVEAIFGRAVNLTLSDTVTNAIVRPEEVRIANVLEMEALELLLATGVAAPGTYNRSIVNQSYQRLRGTNFTNSGGGNINILLPDYAQLLPWCDNNTNQQTLYVIVRTNVTVNRGGTYVVNKGPAVSYVNHFNETVKIKGNNEYIEAHGPAFYYTMEVMSIKCDDTRQPYLTGGKNNTVSTSVKCYNWGDDIAQGSTLMINLPSTVQLDMSSLPKETRFVGKNNQLQWYLGDIGPGSEKLVVFSFFTTPPEINLTTNRGPPEPWLLIDNARVKFIHSYLQKPVLAQPSSSLLGYLFDSDLAMVRISYSHPFAATNNTHKLYAHVKNNWLFSDTIHNIKVNFSVDDVYIGTGTIPKLVPGETAKCSVNFVFKNERIYKIKAEIAGPEMNEFYDTNNVLESSIIAVDPVTLYTEPDFGTGTDTFVSHWDPTLTFGDQHNLKVGLVSSSGGYGSGIGISRSYLNFDMSGIPKNALVLDAELKLYMYKSAGGNLKVSAYQVLNPWGEGNTTYNQKPASNNTPISTITVDTNIGYKTWDITNAVTGWVANPSNNYGLMLRSDIETIYWWKEFYSTDAENGLRPQLIVHYAMLEETPDITRTNLVVADYKDRELRLEWTPVPYAIYYEIYRSDTPSGPYNKLGDTWDQSVKSSNGSLDTYFYDDVDGGYPEPPTVINTDRGGLPGTIRVFWETVTAPEPSESYYYRIKAIGEEDRNSALDKSPTEQGQLTPEIEKYIIYSSSSYYGPWDDTALLVETEKLTYSHSGLPPGKVMYYRLKSVSTESFKSSLSKVVWGRSNRLPTINNLNIEPESAYTTDYLLAKYNFTDLDNDIESGSQIRWYRDGKLISTYNDKSTISPIATKKGQVWYFTVNPKDGIEFGTISTSGMRTILNSPPVLSNMNILPAEPVTIDNLTISYKFTDPDADTETGFVISWYKNGISQPKFNNVKSLSASATRKGDVWNATMMVSDGTEYSILYQVPPVTIRNSAPEVTNVCIDPAIPKTADPLNAVYTYSDVDSDIETGTNINWYKNDILQSVYSDQFQVPAQATSKGEVWYFTVKPNDGEDFGLEVTSPAVKIDNTPPQVSDLKIYPDEPRTGDTLWIEYTYFDADLDNEIGSIIKWYRDDNLVADLTNAVQVPSSYTAKGQYWSYSVTPKDNFNFGETVFSFKISIKNTPPVITDAKILPQHPAVRDDLEGTYIAVDDDDDKIIDISIKWFRDSVMQPELVDELLVPAKYTQPGEVWYFELSASDDNDFGPVVKAEQVRINILPKAAELVIKPTEPTSADELQAAYQWSDADASDVEVNSIIHWFRNMELVEELTNSLIVPAELTVKEEKWHFTVSPSDGKDYGPEVASPKVKILNTPPTAGEPVIIRSTVMDVNNEFIYMVSYKYHDLDSDPEQGSEIQWFRNGKNIPELADSMGIPFNLLVRGDEWYFAVKPSDGIAFGIAIYSPSILIDNLAPVLRSARIEPELPRTLDDLKATLEYYDPDGDDLELFTPEIRWYKADQLQSEFNDVIIVPKESTVKGEVWYFTVRIYDGMTWSAWYQSENVTIINSAPTAVDLRITPQRPNIGTPLIIWYTYSDIDTDPERGTLIRWYRENILIEDLNDKTTVPDEYLHMGDEWYCELSPGDGLDLGETSISQVVRINTAPTALNIKLLLSSENDQNIIKLSYDYIDPDNDKEDKTEIHWYRNGQREPTLDGFVKIPMEQLHTGDEWYVTVQPHDGFEFGIIVSSNSINLEKGMLEDLDSDKGAGGLDIFLILALILVIIIILVIGFLLFVSRSRHAKEAREVREEFNTEQEPMSYKTSGLELEGFGSDHQEYSYSYDTSEQHTKHARSQVIPQAAMVNTTSKDEDKTIISMSMISSRGLDVENTSTSAGIGELLPYDMIDIEFKCPICESDIDTETEVCPDCGEVFGKI